MCVRVTCSKCGKASWAGCGAHVESVLKGVPEAERCQCPKPKGSGLRRFMLPLAVLLGGCLFFLGGKGDVSSADAHALVKSGAKLVDVRTPEEFQGGHLEGAVNVPVDELETRLSELGPKENKLVVYCRSGMRSARAAEVLRKAGHEVFDLGSMRNW